MKADNFMGLAFSVDKINELIVSDSDQLSKLGKLILNKFVVLASDHSEVAEENLSIVEQLIIEGERYHFLDRVALEKLYRFVSTNFDPEAALRRGLDEEDAPPSQSQIQSYRSKLQKFERYVRAIRRRPRSPSKSPSSSPPSKKSSTKRRQAL